MNFSASLNDSRARSQFCGSRNAATLGCGECFHFCEGVSTDESKSQGDFISCGCCRTADGSPGTYGESGPAQSPASQLAALRRRADSFDLDRVAMASAESLRPGAWGDADTFSYPLILHLQDSRIRLVEAI